MPVAIFAESCAMRVQSHAQVIDNPLTDSLDVIRIHHQLQEFYTRATQETRVDSFRYFWGDMEANGSIQPAADAFDELEAFGMQGRPEEQRVLVQVTVASQLTCKFISYLLLPEPRQDHFLALLHAEEEPAQLREQVGLFLLEVRTEIAVAPVAIEEFILLNPSAPAPVATLPPAISNAESSVGAAVAREGVPPARIEDAVLASESPQRAKDTPKVVQPVQTSQRHSASSFVASVAGEAKAGLHAVGAAAQGVERAAASKISKAAGGVRELFNRSKLVEPVLIETVGASTSESVPAGQRLVRALDKLTSGLRKPFARTTPFEPVLTEVGEPSSRGFNIRKARLAMLSAAMNTQMNVINAASKTAKAIRAGVAGTGEAIKAGAGTVAHVAGAAWDRAYNRLHSVVRPGYDRV